MTTPAMAVHCLDGVDLEQWQGQWRGAGAKRYPRALSPTKSVTPLTSGAETYETFQPYVRYAYRHPNMWNFARRCAECDIDFKCLDDYVMHQLRHDSEFHFDSMDLYVLGLIQDLPGVDRSTVSAFIKEEYGHKILNKDLDEILRHLRDADLIRREGRERNAGWFAT